MSISPPEGQSPPSPRFSQRMNRSAPWQVRLGFALLATLVVAGLIFYGIALAFPGPTLVPTTTAKFPTHTPEPTLATLPMLSVQPSLQPEDDQRLGGTLRGIAKLYPYATIGPDSAEALATLDGKQVDVVFTQYPSAADATGLDNQPHITLISVVAKGPDQVVSAATIEAYITSFLPRDATYVGDKTGSSSTSGGVALTAHVYKSASLAATFPANSNVFSTGCPQAAPAGELIWARSSLDNGGTDCGMVTGSVA